MATSLKYTAYQFIWGALDLLFPPYCGGCGTLGARWCADCQGRVKPLTGILCDACGLPINRPGLCDSCRADRPHFFALRAWAIFDDPIRHALHQLKYKRNMSMGDAIASQMAAFVRELRWPMDMIVPIPLGRKRLKERGYNQVAMIARPLALSLGVEYAPRELIRCKETRSQVELSKAERKENVRDAFQAGGRMKDRNIVIMDDVSTTGATLSSAAEILYKAGAKQVFALTVARALPHHGLQIA